MIYPQSKIHDFNNFSIQSSDMYRLVVSLNSGFSRLFFQSSSSRVSAQSMFCGL